MTLRSLDETFDLLRSSYALERASPLTGDPFLLCDLEHAAEPAAAAGRAAARGLRELACPTIGWLGDRGEPEGPALAALTARFDLVLRTKGELEPVLDTVHRRPVASLALVQLLRHGETLDLHEALIAESLVYSTLQAGPEFRAWRDGRDAPSPRPAPLAPAVLCERDGRELVITLNRPAKHNAFSAEMRDDLAEALHVALADADLQRIVLRGAGRSFCSGGDLDEFGTFPDPATAHVIRSTRNPGRLLVRCADRVTVELHGACVGAGIELPAFARRVCARDDAFFLLPEVQMGLVPGAGGTASLPRRIGRQRTAWLALSGERIDPATALDWGLIDERTAPAG